MTANPYTLSGLDASSNYEFYVVANCSADDASEESDSFTFATECDVIPALGYNENFDSYTAGDNVLPTCWSYINTTTNSTYAAYPRILSNGSYSTYANTAPNCLYFYSYGNSDPQPQYAILPEMTGLAGLQVTLMAKGYNTSSTFKIGMMSDPTDASTFTMIAEQTLTTSYPTDPFEYLIPADCSDNYLAIMMDAAPSGYNTSGVYVDDIVIREAPTYLKPTELAVTGVSTTTATLSWIAGDSETAWQICLNGDETNLILAESNPFTLEGLATSTAYTAKVRAYCNDDDQSDWSNEVSFATKCEAIVVDAANPFTEGFEGDWTPLCWESIPYIDGTTTRQWTKKTSSSYIHTGAGAAYSGYYLIASPVTVDLTNHEMTTGDFDLYYFDQAQGKEWINYEGENGNFNLEPGKGYLYAKKATTEGEIFEFTLTGTSYDGDGTIELVYDDNAIDFKGWNLVGNPWGVKAYPNHAFYTINEDGSGIDVTPNVAGTEVTPMTGIFVVAEAANETVTFDTENPNSKSANLTLNITRNNKLVDRAIVRFGEGRQLPKFQLNPNHTKVFIPQDNKDYAIVSTGSMGTMPVNFKAENNGSYTLTISEPFTSHLSPLTFNYLHLIDNMTGTDVDLLANPSYTFNAKTTDYASRFKLVYSAGNLDESSDFAFMSDGNLIVNGKGTLQVFDVLGHQLFSRALSTANCQLPTANFSKGVYVIRLTNGNDVKTIKIVIE